MSDAHLLYSLEEFLPLIIDANDNMDFNFVLSDVLSLRVSQGNFHPISQ
jgi:hypothetical protein